MTILDCLALWACGAAHSKHQPAILEARRRGDQEEGLVAVLEVMKYGEY